MYCFHQANMRKKKNTSLQANSKFTLHFLFIHMPGKKKKKTSLHFQPKVISQCRTTLIQKKESVFSFSRIYYWEKPDCHFSCLDVSPHGSSF